MTFPRIMVRAGMVAALLGIAAMAFAQVIEYESNGEKYQTLTRRGLTVIVTHMPVEVAGYALIQVSIANGSDIHWTVKPEQFGYARGGNTTEALSADDVVNVMLAHASSNDTIKLITAYERALYAIPNMRGKNGYEERRQSALAFGGSTKLRAAAAASAITLAQVRLAPGDSTDGAVFIHLGHDQKSLTGGRVVLNSEGETFEFNPD
ncbi:MAG TPA: hypothetical protein VHC90_02985 [Bryobacteraceae bacterium]|nr:hypothetical protein [Bryobacteraceae bacterium]